jgi:DNA-binding transcriptional ArsR family regulator
VSTEAVKWAMDDAPMLRTDKGKPDSSARYVLWALAEHARPDGTNAHPSVLRLQYRTGLDDRTVQRALRRLEKGGLIKATGTVQGRTKWRLAMHLRRPEFDWAELEAVCEEQKKATAERVRRHRANRVTHSGDVTETHSGDVTEPDVTHAEDVSNALGERYVTHSDDVCNALNAPLTTNEPPEEPPGTSSSSRPGSNDDQEDLTEFGNFWILYPKSRDKPATLTAWRTAVASGVSPQKITAAAMAYANERRGQDQRFTKYSANWLRDGRYDDVIDPDQPPPPGNSPGSWRPFRNPDNHDVYDEDLI